MNNDMKNLNEVVEQIKQVETGVNNMIVPILKDTIADTNKHNKRLFILCIISLASMLVMGIYSQILIFKQNEKYTEFLSQFEFESEVIQELNADGNSSGTINSGIDISK